MRNTMARFARLVQTRSVQVRLVLGLAVMALLLASNIPTAHADELVHDATTPQWRATGKITSSTPGIKLYLDDVAASHHMFVKPLPTPCCHLAGRKFG